MIRIRSFLVFSATVILFVEDYGSAEGGIAEMKALTGDAPYLGTGNQEQAPEYFGSAAYRQYAADAGQYAPPGLGYRSRYAYNAMNSLNGGQGLYGPMGGYRLPYRGYGTLGNYPTYTLTDYGINGPASIPPIGGRNGYYTGRGNEWIVKH